MTVNNTAEPAANLLTPFDPRSPRQVHRLIRMHQAYVTEELERDGHLAHGHPVGSHLTTYWLQHHGQTAGFCSVDESANALELIYIDPRHRRHGLARRAFAELAAGQAEPVRVKSPLTPSMQALVDALDLDSPWSPRQAQAYARQLQETEHALSRYCPHLSVDAPQTPCLDCYRRSVVQGAEDLIGRHLVALVGPATLRAVQERMTRKPSPRRKRRK
ncbi:GNAT family N-acetyltransferase [Streptomyces sp. LN245]|uniref:GNAT family N-acetyltransferase n=1 Tax=Streptomyces sp. LN245 TaxID=3112975 RepID=UPI0037131B94